MRFITRRTSKRWPYVEPATLAVLYPYDPSVRLAICLVALGLGLMELWGYYGSWHGAWAHEADIVWGCGGALLGFILAVAEVSRIRGHENGTIARLLARNERKSARFGWQPGLIGASVVVALMLANARWGHGWDHLAIALVAGFCLGNLLAYPLWRGQWRRLRQAAHDSQGGL